MVVSTRLYDLLGLKPDAKSNEIKKAYHTKALEYHPDKATDEESRQQNEQIFKDVSEAYSILSDENKRRIYDQTGNTNTSNGPSVNPDNLFSSLFGGGRMGGSPFASFFNMGGNMPSRGKTVPRQITKLVNVSIKDLYCRESKVVEVETLAKCETCEGSGAKSPSARKSCELCYGEGSFTDTQQMGPILTQRVIPCHQCNGEGETVARADYCQTCEGQRSIIKIRKFKITFDNTSKDGDKIVYKGRGNWVASNTSDGLTGDLVFQIRLIPDSNFQRHGNSNHLQTTIKVTVHEALVARHVNFTHLDGKQITLKWEGQLNPSQTYIVPGAGLGSDTVPNGNLLVNFQVVYPTEITETTRQKLIELFSYQSPTMNDDVVSITQSIGNV